MLEDKFEEIKNSPIPVSTIEPIIIGNFRFIKPYCFTFHCYAKQRWIGRKLVDVFVKEFKHINQAAIEERIANGMIRVNNSCIGADYVIKNRDLIEHTTVRHEMPIYNQPIIKLGETDDYIAFLKPASVPVYSAGGYFYNSMLKMVDNKLHPVHRLDKVTSGIVVMAKDKQHSTMFAEMLKEKKIEKTYIARVLGVFPEGEIKVNAPIKEAERNRKFRECGEGGKESLTVFKRLSTNGEESIVECHPITGRTHQIRVHLSYLKHPISNDISYGGNERKLTKDEVNALEEARKRGLWPPDTIMDDENPANEFGIYLHSIHYKSDVFDFHAPMPEWAELPKKKSSYFNCNVY